VFYTETERINYQLALSKTQYKKFNSKIENALVYAQNFPEQPKMERLLLEERPQSQEQFDKTISELQDILSTTSPKLSHMTNEQQHTANEKMS
jgi:DNA-binding transcriptional regulator of glucitol operon